MEEVGLIVRRAMDGDAEAFRTLVRRFQDMAVGYAFSILGDFHLAEDAAQEAFLAAYLDLPKLQAPAAFPGWFRRIVFTHCNRLTRGKRREAVSLEDTTEIVSQRPDPHEDAEAREMNEVVRRAIQDLPEHERRATTLFYISDYSQKEIAAFLEAPLTTVQKRLHDARRRLKKRMIEMLRGEMSKHAPSRDDTFVRRLEKAIQESDIERLKKLIQEDPDLVNRECEWFARKYNSHPLAYAANFGKIDVMKILNSFS